MRQNAKIGARLRLFQFVILYKLKKDEIVWILNNRIKRKNERDKD